jgi:hypothetical protein
MECRSEAVRQSQTGDSKASAETKSVHTRLAQGLWGRGLCEGPCHRGIVARNGCIKCPNLVWFDLVSDCVRKPLARSMRSNTAAPKGPNIMFVGAALVAARKVSRKRRSDGGCCRPVVGQPCGGFDFHSWGACHLCPCQRLQHPCAMISRQRRTNSALTQTAGFSRRPVNSALVRFGGLTPCVTRACSQAARGRWGLGGVHRRVRYPNQTIYRFPTANDTSLERPVSQTRLPAATLPFHRPSYSASLGQYPGGLF